VGRQVIRLAGELAGEDHAPVLALTLIDARSAGRNGTIEKSSSLLVGVRDPETNITHPNVVSVPTKRIPKCILDGFLVEMLRKSSPGASTTYIVREIQPDPRANGHSKLFFAVKSILAEKLGLAEQLERGEVSFATRLEAIVVGTVKHLEFEEKTCMFNASVFIQGADHIPSKTSSYRSLIWTPISSFMLAAEHKDLTKISPNLNPFEYCIHGLCIMSSFEFLTSVLGGKPYPFDKLG